MKLNFKSVSTLLVVGVVVSMSNANAGYAIPSNSTCPDETCDIFAFPAVREVIKPGFLAGRSNYLSGGLKSVGGKIVKNTQSAADYIKAGAQHVSGKIVNGTQVAVEYTKSGLGHAANVTSAAASSAKASAGAAATSAKAYAGTAVTSAKATASAASAKVSTAAAAASETIRGATAAALASPAAPYVGAVVAVGAGSYAAYKLIQYLNSGSKTGQTAVATASATCSSCNKEVPAGSVKPAKTGTAHAHSASAA